MSLSGVIIELVRLSNCLSNTSSFNIYFLKYSKFFLLCNFFAETFKYFFGISFYNSIL
jgi:hypothetical protein